MSLNENIKQLKCVVREYGFDRDIIELGIIKKSDLESIEQKIVIGEVLHKFYSSCNPVHFEINWSVEWLNLYPVSEIMNAQIGYRWLDEKCLKKDELWMSNWIVIGNVSSDPIIVDADSTDARVYMAIHGTGKWEPLLIAPSLSDFIKVVTEWIKLVYGEYKGKIRNNDCTINQKFLDILKGRLEFLPCECLMNFMSFVDG